MADRKTQKLLEGLQQDLEREEALVLQYMFQSAVVLGMHAVHIAPYLRKGAEDELAHVAFFCDQIVNLGAVPKLTSQKYDETRDLKQMLEKDLDRERDTILELRERTKQAELAGEMGLKIQLEQLIADETDHMRSLERMLRGWD